MRLLFTKKALGSLLAQIDKSWQPLFAGYDLELAKIKAVISAQRITPDYQNILRVFTFPINHYRAVIVGQDPYPTPGYANGLAFSVSPEITKLPASLKNIFTEYVSDTGFNSPTSGDLSSWANNGVALLNTSLTLNLDNKTEHLNIGWQRITAAALAVLAHNGSVAILWGSHAQKMGSEFPTSHKIESAHPSPLSAYRGFFGSKPFTNCNQMLISSGQVPIDWRLP
ncbi:MAG: uracil-DNA glycosylase [Actinobacteria bacterium]|nr:uracil-DNA glycosylase [Actinomycetota bacterium]